MIYRVVCEKHRAPLILDKAEEGGEDDEEGYDDEDDDGQTTVQNFTELHT